MIAIYERGDKVRIKEDWRSWKKDDIATVKSSKEVPGHGWMVELDSNEDSTLYYYQIAPQLKNCPICGGSVKCFEEKSPDGTITWLRIHHGPSTPCGISFIDDESVAIQKWNTMIINSPDGE